jgi:hypothetical protein
VLDLSESKCERRRRLGWILAGLLVLPLAGCNSGGECDICSSDDDCDSGLTCSRFDDGSWRCASGEGVTSCDVF